MKTFVRFLFVLGIIAVFNISYASEVQFTEGTYADVLAKAKQENKIVMIDFVTDWCKWCIETDKQVYTEPGIYEFANTYQVNWKIDAEKGEGIDLAKKYNIKGYPTIVFVDADGNEVDRIYGYIFADEFLQKMKDYNSGINTYTSLKTAVESDPSSAEANWKFAEKLISYGDYDEAKPYLGKVISLDGGNSAGYTDDAEFTMAFNPSEGVETDATITAIKALMEKYPESNSLKDAYVSIANFSGGRDFNEAKNYYRKAFEKFGGTDELLQFNYGIFLYSYAYSMMKDEKATDESRKEALSIIYDAMLYVAGTVNEASAYYVRSELYYQLGDKENAIEAIDTAIMLYDKKVYREQKDKINGVEAKK
jgi:thioredoxin-related protein